VDHSTVFGFACLLIGASLVAAQLLTLWNASKERSVTEVRQYARVVANAAGSAAASAEAASLAAEAAVLRASSMATTSDLGAEGMSALQAQADVALEATTAAKQQARQAKEDADKADKAAGGATINDVLASIANRTPLGVLGFLFAVLGAMSMGFVDISFGAAAGS